MLHIASVYAMFKTHENWQQFDNTSPESAILAPDSRNPYGWYPLKMHQITRASPAELRTIVRAIWRSIGYTTICASNRYILDKIKIIPPL